MAARAVPAPLAKLPNALTLGRLALIPIFVVLMIQAGDAPSWPAGIVFGIAGVTDQVDGYLARRWHVESRFGKIADPLADRLMIDAAVILLVWYGRLPWIGLVGDHRARRAPDRRLPRALAAGLRARREHARQGGDLGALRGDRLPHRHRRTRPCGRCGCSGSGSGWPSLAALFYVRDAWNVLRR